ncbi:RIP metalloprotease RseP [Flavobacterium sp.]|jgi:regulator of sigma E protease|uniref:RIP metalloprotease RseP n=1 Tax=Flavobacterium sp. TaxID=239 RepID=UPI0037C0D45F
MEFAIKLSQFLLSLSILIVLHELGHFIPAKLFKTRVEKFYLFFDIKYSLFKKKIGGTEYGIGWLPLGGYVKISGMIDESMDKEQMALPAQPWEFRSKPTWQRLIIMLGGVTVNFILAFIIYIGMTFYYGEQYIANENVKDGIWVSNPIVEKLGFKTGDKIVSIDGVKVQKFDDINKEMFLAKEVALNRDGNEIKIKLPVNFIDQLMKSERGNIINLRMPFVIGAVPKESPNKNILKPKDIITSCNGQTVTYADELIVLFQNLKGKTVPAIIKRDGKDVALNLSINESGKLGVLQASLPYDNLEKLGLYKINKQEYGFFQSIPVGITRGFNELASYGKQLKAIFSPSTGAYKGVGGFGAIFNIFPSTWSWFVFWNITALLSIMLGVMNLLPIPALDGGHVIFLLYEMVSGKKPTDKFLERAQMVGFVLLITLLLFANGNDIYKAIVGK